MPSAVNTVNIAQVQYGAIVQAGDSVRLLPSSSVKTYAGSGSFITGGIVNASSAASATNTSDPDVVDGQAV